MKKTNPFVISNGHLKPAAAAALLLVLLSACSGLKPMEVRNNREEGPEKGLFTEEAGEFVIFRYGNTPQSESAPASDEAESTKEETE